MNYEITNTISSPLAELKNPNIYNLYLYFRSRKCTIGYRKLKMRFKNVEKSMNKLYQR